MIAGELGNGEVVISELLLLYYCYFLKKSNVYFINGLNMSEVDVWDVNCGESVERIQVKSVSCCCCCG